jgi:hypothetical protein
MNAAPVPVTDNDVPTLVPYHHPMIHCKTPRITVCEWCDARGTCACAFELKTPAI